MHLSLRRLLLLTLLTLTVGGAASVGVISYRAARHALEREAVRLTGLVAENRRASLVRTFTRQRERLSHMVDAAVARCGRTIDPEDPAACFRRSAEAFASFEGATAARLSRPGEPPILVGPWHRDDTMPPGQIASIHRDQDGEAAYVLAVTRRGVTLAVELPIARIQHILADRTGLGAHGETFLVAADGRPLTPTLDPVAASQPDSGDPRQACLAGASGELLGPDYRGIGVIHGYRSVPEIGGCVMAHIGQDEAFSPAAVLGRQLAVTILLIGALGVGLSVLLASRIGAPIRRLQVSARRLQGGDFDTEMQPTGPTEVRDLTEAFQAMARSLRDSHESLAAANRLKDEFLATLSHELRTPLNAIVGWTALLRTSPDPRRMARGLEVIERNAKVQSELVSDLLDMSRVIRGTLRLQPARVDLTDVVRTAIDTVRPAADAKGIGFVTDLTRCAMIGDAARLQQVVWNLLLNAVKFTPHGGSIFVTVTRGASEVELTVEDTGPGIQPDFLPHVFEPFRQADSGPARAHGGLGLGLAIVRRLVELHGGRVSAANGRTGAKFTVRLPAAAALDQAASPSVESAAARSTLEGLNVLVVEDHDDTRELVVAILHEHGATVESAANTRDAMTAFRRNVPNVLVADLGLPEEDGYVLIQWVRALSPSEGGVTPALALTAYARDEDRAQALAAGFTRHLAKPVDSAALIAAVAAVAPAATGEVG